MNELDRYKAAYKIMRLSHGTIDSEDAFDISAAVVGGKEIDWNKYSESTKEVVLPLLTNKE